MEPARFFFHSTLNEYARGVADLINICGSKSSDISAADILAVLLIRDDAALLELQAALKNRKHPIWSLAEDRRNIKRDKVAEDLSPQQVLKLSIIIFPIILFLIFVLYYFFDTQSGRARFAFYSVIGATIWGYWIALIFFGVATVIKRIPSNFKTYFSKLPDNIFVQIIFLAFGYALIYFPFFPIVGFDKIYNSFILIALPVLAVYVLGEEFYMIVNGLN